MTEVTTELVIQMTASWTSEKGEPLSNVLPPQTFVFKGTSAEAVEAMMSVNIEPKV